MNQLKAGVVRRFDPRSATRNPLGLGSMSVQVVLRVRTTTLGPKAPESPILGYKDVQSGFEGSLLVSKRRVQIGP
jgi:hypothetical protein